MRRKTTAVAVAATLVIGTGSGYLAGFADNETSAAQIRPSVSHRPTVPMGSAAGGSKLGRQHARMMRDPAMRLHHDRVKTFPEMAHEMREHMEG